MSFLILLYIVVGIGLAFGLTKLRDKGHATLAGTLAWAAGTTMGLLTFIGPFWPPFLGAVTFFFTFGLIGIVRRARRKSASR